MSETAKLKAVMLGAGGHAQMMAAHIQQLMSDTVELCGWVVAKDDSVHAALEQFMNLPVWTEDEVLYERLQNLGITSVFMGLGMVRSAPWRRELIQQWQVKGFTLQTFIHPTAVIGSQVLIGEGCFIGAQAIIQPFAALGDGVIVNTGAIVEHHVTVGDNTHVAPGAVVCGHVSLGADVLIGANASVLQNLAVADRATVGAGSVVITDIGEAETVVGNPARTRIFRS